MLVYQRVVSMFSSFGMFQQRRRVGPTDMIPFDWSTLLGLVSMTWQSITWGHQWNPLEEVRLSCTEKVVPETWTFAVGRMRVASEWGGWGRALEFEESRRQSVKNCAIFDQMWWLTNSWLRSQYLAGGFKCFIYFTVLKRSLGCWSVLIPSGEVGLTSIDDGCGISRVLMWRRVNTRIWSSNIKLKWIAWKYPMVH